MYLFSIYRTNTDYNFIKKNSSGILSFKLRQTIRLHLTDIADELLQSQLIRPIRHQNFSRELPAGTRLPSIRALATKQKVHVIAVQRQKFAA
jgi:hypothetical protein